MAITLRRLQRSAMRALWAEAGLTDIATWQVEVERSFPDFEDFWETILIAIDMRDNTRAMGDEARGELKVRLRARMTPDAAGRVAYRSRANAIAGRVPG